MTKVLDKNGNLKTSITTVGADSSITVNSNEFDMAPSGGSLDVPVVDTADNPVGSIISGEVVIANSEISINTIQVGDVPAEDTLSINVTLNGSNSGTWNSGAQTWEVTCADTTIEVNGTTEGTFNAGSTVDVQLSDSGGVVTPDSVTIVGNDVQIVLPDVLGGSVGATLMKTGQTTSYRTGDDGDLEAGRATSFFVLASNNPFGNTNRFTDELGGSTYTNNWVIDWSTFDGATVLGYYRVVQGNPSSWNTAVDTSASGTFGGFSGCRLTNPTELLNIRSYETTVRFNFTPFNIVAGAAWLWTNGASGLGVAYASATNSTNVMVIRASGESVTYGYIPVRTFTVTGTTLT